MSLHVRPTISVQRTDFDVAYEISRLTRDRADIGGVVTFTGLCRDENGALDALELEHYAGMAERELARVAEDASARWPVTGLTIIHRYGKLTPGEKIVFVAAASHHRQAAFNTAEYVMDYLKNKAPFWKKEFRNNSENWVDAKAYDEDALRKWE